MSASDHFGPQLQMFIPAGAFRAAHAEGNLEFGDGENVPMLSRDKIEEAHEGSPSNAHGYGREPHEPSFYDDVKAKGVQEPVEVQTGDDGSWLRQGHHRVFVSEDIDPKREVPVIHGGSTVKPNGRQGFAPPRYPTPYQLETLKEKRGKTGE